MADYIYTMEIRLTPDQQRGVTLVQDIARAAGMNIYLTGGAVRDIISGFPIRDLDFSVQGNPFKLQKDLERAGVRIAGTDDDLKTLYLGLPGNVRAEITMARIERYEKAGKPPIISPATLIEDLRRRDFTINAMALSLNPGSRGLLMDPFNGAADIEAKLLRVLHNYAFVEDPSRLIRASRFAARFHWPLEERTQARFESAKENNYIEYIGDKAIGYEIEQLAYEDDPLHIVKVLEKEGWLKVLNQHWTSAKVDTAQLGQLLKTRQQMTELGYAPDPAPAVMYFLTARLADKDIADMRKQIPRKDLVEAWRDLEDHAKELAKRLSGKEAATPSRTWKLLSEASRRAARRCGGPSLRGEASSPRSGRTSSRSASSPTASVEPRRSASRAWRGCCPPPCSPRSLRRSRIASVASASCSRSPSSVRPRWRSRRSVRLRTTATPSSLRQRSSASRRRSSAPRCRRSCRRLRARRRSSSRRTARRRCSRAPARSSARSPPPHWSRPRV